MASDTSRKIFDPLKHYSGVLMQQGRVQLDSDWNEQLDIHQYRTRTETIDVIGASGVPKKGNSFKISAPIAGDLAIAAGHIYVGGLLCELEAATTYLTQPYFPNPDSSFFSGIPSSPPTSPAGSPPSPATLGDGAYIVYADAWQREINHLDDPRIREVALGEADTTTRLQTVWQVKLLGIQDLAADCKSNIPEWNSLVAPPTGTLNVQTSQAPASDNPCLLPPQSGYRRLENQHYRVEVHSGGTLAQATFKWSRDNASVETGIISPVNGNIITVADLGKDEMLGFAIGQWVEIVDEESSLNSSPKPLCKIQFVDPGRREIILATPPPPASGKMKLRRWDQNGTATGLPAGAAWLDLEDGIRVTFSAGTYRPGDYWLIPARTATGEVEWSPFQVPNNSPQAQLPHGTQHAYCRLALLRVAGGKVDVSDCRPKFPALTEICAEDICYNSGNCGNSKAKTVQEALDELCRLKGGNCTFVAMPGPGWESVFSQIGDGMDAQVCFQVGEYPLSAAVNISKKGNLKLIGGGRGTRIVASGSEAALVFDACTSVLIRDMYAETGKTGFHPADKTSDLNGALNFIDCGEVQVDSVDLKCGTGKRRAATCLTVRNADVVRISNCDLKIGHQQQGILLVNTKEAFVENNTLKVYAKPVQFNPKVELADNMVLASHRTAVVSELRITTPQAEEPLGSRNVSMTVGNRTIALSTPGRLKSTMERILREAPPQTFESERSIRNYVDSSVNRLFLNDAYRINYPAFEGYYIEAVIQSDAVASQGITVGGTAARQIKISNNTLEGVQQGIHVGVSHSAARRIHDHSGSVNICGNSITILLMPNSHKLGRHGIFVGNCKDLLIENNNIRINRLPESDYVYIDGIRVWGIFGDRLMIDKNYVASVDENPHRSFDVGIRVHPIIPMNAKLQHWVVMWNVAPSKQVTVITDNGVFELPDTNVPL